MTKPAQVVVFDVGNVLVRWDRALPFVALIPDAAERAWFLEKVIPLSWHAEHDAGRPAAEMMAERSSLFPEHADLIRIWFDRFNESIPGPIPGSPELVAELAARGTPLYAITNFGADTWSGFAPTFSLLEQFRDIVVSGVEKLTKPGADIYALAERRFGHPPESMLFVDDSLPNVEAARQRGWHGHHFTDAASLRDDLCGHGLLD